MRILWLSLLPMIATAGCRDDRFGQRKEDRQTRARRLAGDVAALKKRVAGLEIVRGVLRWDGLTGTEPGRMRALLPITNELITEEQLFELRRLENSFALPGRAERRKLRYLRNHLTRLYLMRRAAGKGDQLLDQVSANLRLEGAADPVRFVELRAIAAGIHERSRRQRAEALRVPVLQKLDRLLEGYHHEIRREAARLGLSYFDLMEEHEEWDTRRLLSQATSLNRRHDALFRFVWRSVVESALPKDKARVTPGDLDFVVEGGLHRANLQEKTLFPALQHLLDGLGLKLHSNNEDEPMRRSDGLYTTVVAVHPPGDVRLVYRPEAGMRAYIDLFEAAGRALCRARSRNREWALRTLGPQLGARTVGYLFGLVWTERAWWERYLALPEPRSRPGGEHDQQVKDLIRTNVLLALIRLRVEGVVVPIVRTTLQGGPSRTFEGIWSGAGQGNASSAVLFGRLMERQVGLKLTQEESLAWVDHFLPLGRAPFDLRAYALAHRVHELLLRRFGRKWFVKPAAGRLVLEELCATGSLRTPRELASAIGIADPADDLDAPWDRLAALWGTLHGGPPRNEK